MECPKCKPNRTDLREVSGLPGLFVCPGCLIVYSLTEKMKRAMKSNQPKEKKK